MVFSLSLSLLLCPVGPGQGLCRRGRVSAGLRGGHSAGGRGGEAGSGRGAGSGGWPQGPYPPKSSQRVGMGGTTATAQETHSKHSNSSFHPSFLPISETPFFQKNIQTHQPSWFPKVCPFQETTPRRNPNPEWSIMRKKDVTVVAQFCNLGGINSCKETVF